MTQSGHSYTLGKQLSFSGSKESQHAVSGTRSAEKECIEHKENSINPAHVLEARGVSKADVKGAEHAQTESDMEQSYKTTKAHIKSNELRSYDEQLSAEQKENVRTTRKNCLEEEKRTSPEESAVEEEETTTQTCLFEEGQIVKSRRGAPEKEYLSKQQHIENNEDILREEPFMTTSPPKDMRSGAEDERIWREAEGNAEGRDGKLSEKEEIVGPRTTPC